MHLGSKSKECLRPHIIVARAEGGILYLLPWYPDGKDFCAKMCITVRKCALSVSNCANLCQAVPKRAEVGIIRTFNAVWHVCHNLAQFDMV